ncbi:hypothetical protein [Psychromicrobium lacuslunae]|uniref:Lipoprotein LpqN n=1 Tax=Psychromicrobium lacuslunae TaxID=1618207 RepID=A0A0D4C1D8_9MICC|nr:hypothetical protein [Psychromicrobium lacuslunae]AJT42374.1 hypothetical protein UM93_14320 [Psychromicrobium lacuslunae]
MTVSRFPSAQFPGFPSVSVEVPEGWLPRAVQDTLAAWVRPEESGEFASNLVLSITRLATPRSLAEATESIEQATSQLNEVELFDSVDVTLNGQDWHVHEYVFVHPQVGTLIQVMAVASIQSGEFTDTVQLTGSISPANQERDVDAVRDIIRSAEVTVYSA